MKFNLIILVIAFFVSSLVHAESVALAKVNKISGIAFSNNKEIKVGDVVSEGQTIEIKGKKDFIEIKYQNGHIIRLQGGQLKISELKAENSTITLLRGTLFNLVHKLLPNETFKVKTTQASFAVRGTKFYLQADDLESYLCVCDGVVNAVKNDDPKKSVDVHIDEDLFVNKEKPFKTTVSSQMMRDMGNQIFDSMK